MNNIQQGRQGADEIVVFPGFVAAAWTSIIAIYSLAFLDLKF